MFVRNTPARTTSSKLLLAAFRTADRFWKTRSVSGTMPPSTTLPVAGSWATCPLKKRRPSILTAWENGPTGGAISGEVMAVLLIATSRGVLLLRPGRNHAVTARVRDRLPQMLVLIFENVHQRVLLRPFPSEQLNRRLQVVVGKSRDRL